MSMKVMAAFLMSAVLAPAAAVAQEWNVYSYPDPGFSIQFPGVPAVETGTVRNPTGVSLPVKRYVVRQDRIIYSVTIVNYSSTNDDALSTIVATQKSLGTAGKVTAVNGARVDRNFGRELSISGTDGSRSAVAIFFVNRHLYTAVAQALPPNALENSDDAVRFQESLQFPDDTGGFGRFFFGSGSSSTSSRSSTSSGGSGNGSAGGAAVAAPARLRADDPPPAAAPCAGKSAGDVVQLETPRGPVPAICTLVARPLPPGTP
jgi:hypothetical protein